jgi:hypothetical protein
MIFHQSQKRSFRVIGTLHRGHWLGPLLVLIGATPGTDRGHLEPKIPCLRPPAGRDRQSPVWEHSEPGLGALGARHEHLEVRQGYLPPLHITATPIPGHHRHTYTRSSPPAIHRNRPKKRPEIVHKGVQNRHQVEGAD